MEKISIIIPVYKVEDYICDCLDSVINQTYKNTEIILVDDGSPDRCPQICDEYAKLDKRIKVIHKKNGGLSSARNAGIEIASGDYFIFMDSDDTMHSRMCEILLNALKENEADIAMCSIKKVYDKHLKNLDNKLKMCMPVVYCGTDEIFDLLYNKQVPMIMTAWAKIYKKQLFDKIRYPEGKIHEDEFVIHEILAKCNKFVYLNIPLMYYLIRKTGITGNKFSVKRLHGVEAKKKRLQFVKENMPNFYSKALNQYCNTLILYYYKSKRAKLEDKILIDLKQEIENVSNLGANNMALKLYRRMPRVLGVLLKLKYK